MKWSSKSRNVKRPREDTNDDEEVDVGQILGALMGPKAGVSHMSNSNIYTIDNNIYFQDDITMESISLLNKELRQMQTKLIELGNAYNIDPPPIRLHLTTDGGLIHAAFSAIDCIRELKVKVHSICDGYVASAGTLISIVCDKRYIKKNAMMLIHELRSGFWGKMSDIEDEFDNLKKLTSMIKKFYVDHTKMKKNELGEILKHDRNWNANECLQKGLVDEIL